MKPFQIHATDDVLEDLKARLRPHETAGLTPGHWLETGHGTLASLGVLSRRKRFISSRYVRL